MTDPYTREERIAIRQFCGKMSEREVTRLTDEKTPNLAQRVAAMAQHQRAQPRPLHMPRHSFTVDNKLLASGEPA